MRTSRKNTNFNSALTLSAFPQLLSIFHHSEMKFADSYSRYIELDMILLYCGLDLDLQKILLSGCSYKHFMLFVFEKAINLDAYFGEVESDLKVMLTKPYTYFKELGLI